MYISLRLRPLDSFPLGKNKNKVGHSLARVLENGSWYYDEVISELLYTILNPPDGTPEYQNEGVCFCGPLPKKVP